MLSNQERSTLSARVPSTQSWNKWTSSDSEGDNEPEETTAQADEADGDGMDVEEDAEGEEEDDEDVDIDDEEDAEGEVEVDEIEPEEDDEEDDDEEEEEEEDVRPTRSSRAAASRSKRKPPPKATKAKPPSRGPPQQPHLKIKLKLPALPSTADTSAAATPTPSETSPSKSISRRRSKGADVESEDEDEDDYDGDNDYSRSTSVTGTAPPARPMTTRQAVLASVVDSSHVALANEGPSKKKKVLNESELALRREETARKRKNLSEKKLEDEKAETINRLLRKQSRPKNKRQTGISSTEDRTPNPPGTKARPSDDEEMQEPEDAVEDVYDVPPPDPVMYRWISSTRIPGEKEEDGEAMQGVEAAEKKMYITFSIPNCVLYPHGQEEELGGGAEDSKPQQGKVVPPLAPVQKPRCAIPSCGKERKYRLVKDWQVGACGMDHLKILEAK